MSDNITELVRKSAATDIAVLLQAKENAKRAVVDDPSAANLAALDRAAKMLEAAQNPGESNIPNWQAVLTYLSEAGRKVGKTKLYEDISKGRLKKQTDGSFRVRDVDKYAASLPMAATPDAVIEKVADRQRRKEEADIRKAEAQARREEFNLAVAQGRYLPREEIAAELATRAVALRDALKNAMEFGAGDVIELVSGDPKQASAMIEYMGRLFDKTMGEYARPMEILMEIDGVGDAPSMEDTDDDN